MAEKQNGEFCWNELATANVKAAKDFYSKVFGWTYREHEMPDTTYTVIELNGKDIGGIWAIPKEKQSKLQPHWVTYILVKDLDAALKKAHENGAKIVKPLTKSGDLGLFGIIEDPTGAHIAFWEPF